MKSIQTTTIQKLLQIHMKNKRRKQVSRLLQPDQRRKQNVLVGTTATIPIHERMWIDIEPSEQNLAAYEVSKKVNSLLRHNGKTMEQFNSTELNSIFEIIIHKYSIALMSVGILVWQQEEVRKEDISIALMIREEFSSGTFWKQSH